MENYLQKLPKDINNIVDKYRIENNPGNKFLKLLVEREELFSYRCYIQMYVLKKYFKDKNYPIEVAISPLDNSKLNLIGELPFIDNEEFKRIINVLIEAAVFSSVINWLLITAGSNFRVIDVAKYRDGKLIVFHGEQITEFEGELKIITIENK